MRNRTILSMAIAAVITLSLSTNMVFATGTDLSKTTGLMDSHSIVRITGEGKDYITCFTRELPLQLLNPVEVAPDINGIVISGITPGVVYDEVYILLKQSADTAAANFITECYNNIGSNPSLTSTPVIEIGIKTANYTAYWNCYYSAAGGCYSVTQYLFPKYSPTDKPTSTIIKSDYLNNTTTVSPY